MDAAFEKLLGLSLQAGIISLVVMALRPLLRKAPKKLVCCLWLLVALRLLVPFSLESRISLMREPALPVILTETVPREASPVEAPAGEVQISQEQPVAPQTGFAGPGIQEQTNHTLGIMNVLEVIWAAGALGMLVYSGIAYGRLRRKVAPAIEIRKGVYLCDYIDSPFVMGTIRPRIYLPSAIAQEDLPYILAHEQAHISRLDPFWKLLGFFLLTLHWFNPILWGAFLLFCRDIEYACDEKVIVRMGASARAPYSNALLNCSLPRGRIYPLAFGEIGVRPRVKEVLHYQKPALWITAVAAGALVITGVCLLTNRPGPSLSELYSFPETEPILVMGSFKAYDMTSEEELKAAEDLLKDLRYDPQPLEKAPDPYALGALALGTGGLMEPKGLFFSPDGSQVAIGTPDAVEAGYEIENPEAVTAFFSQWLQPFADRETHGKPLWEDGSPWVWTKGVTEDRLRKVNIRTWTRNGPDASGSGSYSQGGGIYNTPNVPPLLQLLHGLKEPDFTPAQDLNNTAVLDISSPRSQDSLCTTVYLYDHVDRQVLAIRQEADALDFYASGFYDLALNNHTGSLSFRHWKLRSPALLSYMQSLQENSPTVTTFVGWEHDWDTPREMAYGDARIQLPVIQGWEVEEVPRRDDHTAWGFRVRPAGEEGWLFYSFWPQGFSLEEEDRYYSETGRFGFQKSLISYPATVIKADGSLDTTDAVWSYQLFQCDIGDYAILNEGADPWYFRYREAIDDICMLADFQAMLPEDRPKTAEGPDISLWQKTVTPEDLINPRLIITEATPENAPNRKQATAHLNPGTLESFLSVLRSLNEDQIQDMKYQQKQSLRDLMEPESDHETVAALQLPLKDPGQMLMLVYRSHPESHRGDLRFYISEQYEALMEDPFAKVAYSEYYLNGSTLAAAAEKLVIQVWGQEWRAPILLEQGKARLSVQTILSWEYEEVPYVDDQTPWGLRTRPKGEDGWLFVSFCPKGYLQVDETQLLQHYGPQFDSFGGCVSVKYSDDDYDESWERKPDACWEYCLYRCSFGDYVVFNENADSWMTAHRKEVEDTLTLCEFRGDPVN